MDPTVNWTEPSNGLLRPREDDVDETCYQDPIDMLSARYSMLLNVPGTTIPMRCPLSAFMTRPAETHWQAAERLLRYFYD